MIFGLSTSNFRAWKKFFGYHHSGGKSDFGDSSYVASKGICANVDTESASTSLLAPIAGVPMHTIR
jgi:hypothetical protein